MTWSPFWSAVHECRYNSLSDSPGTHKDKHAHPHTHTQLKTCISLTQSALRWQLKKITLEWKKRRRNWLTYSQLNSCWERGAYLPTTANMSFSIRWKALSLSLIFCSISPGNLFRVGRKKKKKKEEEQNPSKPHWLNARRVIGSSSQSGGADSVNSGPQQQHDYLLYAREKSIWGSSLLVQPTTHKKTYKNIKVNVFACMNKVHLFDFSCIWWFFLHSNSAFTTL